MKKGFATIYIVLILSALVCALLVIIEAASGFASHSICETIGMSAGQSLLGQYNKELYNRYGVFALRADEDELSKEIEKYIEACTNTSGILSAVSGKRAIVRPQLAEVKVYADEYPALSTEQFEKQLNLLAVPGLAKAHIVESFCNEAQRPERSADSKGLPSMLLDIKPRGAISFPAGLFENQISKLPQDEYILSQCGNALKLRGDTWLANEVEYILYGNAADKENLDSVRTGITLLLAIKNGAENLIEDGVPVDPASGAAYIAETAAETAKAVDAIMNGETADGLDYEMCLRILLKLLPKKEKLARLMDIMQMNVRNVDGGGFLFANYCYGFELEASFQRGVLASKAWGFAKRTMNLEQIHVYR